MPRKIAAVVSCGPSVSQTWGSILEQYYDVIVAVNHAIKIVRQYQPDWWVCGDPEPKHYPTCLKNARPRRGLVWDRGFERVAPKGVSFIISHRDLWKPLSLPFYNIYSGVSAIMLLTRLDIVEAHLFGYDMIGTAHFFGNVPEPDHVERWQRERMAFDAALGMVKGKGIKVFQAIASGTLEER